MIRWHLDPVAHGPLVRARILADDGTKREAVGSAIVTRAQLDDLTARLAASRDDALTYEEMESERDRLARELYEAQTKLAALRRYRATVEGYPAVTTLPCARCGKPVPAGHATHADCQPVVCRASWNGTGSYCTQCGKPLSGDERAAGARVCLVSCAPLAEGLVAS